MPCVGSHLELGGNQCPNLPGHLHPSYHSLITAIHPTHSNGGVNNLGELQQLAEGHVIGEFDLLELLFVALVASSPLLLLSSLCPEPAATLTVLFLLLLMLLLLLLLLLLLPQRKRPCVSSAPTLDLCSSVKFLHFL